MWFLCFPQTKESVLTVFLLVSANLETLKWIYGSDYRKHLLRSARKISKNRILHGSPATRFFLLLPGQLSTLWSQYFKLWDEKTEALIVEATFLRWDTKYFQWLKTRALESGFEFRLSLLLLPLCLSVVFIVLPGKLGNSIILLTVRIEWAGFKPGPGTWEAVWTCSRPLCDAVSEWQLVLQGVWCSCPLPPLWILKARYDIFDLVAC